MTASPSGPMPFRLMAIVAEESRIGDLFLLARRWPEVRFGLMLRDPLHRKERVERLAAYALSLGPPAGVSLIANAALVPGLGYLHAPSAWLAGAEDRRADIEGGTTTVVGYSAHDLQEAEHAVRAGGGYVTISPIFPTSSKPGHPGIGLDALHHICERVRVPVFALGGITAANATAIFQAGAYGIASISLFSAGHRHDLESLLEMPCFSSASPESRASGPGML